MLTGSGLDVGSGCLFCAECNNFIFNETIEQVYTSCILYTEEKTTRFQGTFRASRLLRHLRFSQYLRCLDSHILLGFQMSKKPQPLKVLSRFPVKVRSRFLRLLSKSPQKSCTRSTRIIKSRSNVFHECGIAVLDPQSSGPQLFSRRQTQSQTVQD